MADAPELKRAFFGYDKDAVRSILEDRERMFLEVSEEARTAEQKLGTASAELDGVRADLEKTREDLDRRASELEEAQARITRLETDLAAATSQAAEQEQRAREAEERLRAREAELEGRIGALEAQLEEARATPPTGVGELTAVLDATRDAVERIMAGARQAAEEQMAEVERTREQLQAEIERAAAWREQVAPLVDGVRREIGRAQAQVVQVAARVGEALRPMTEALSSLGHNLQDLDRAAAVAEPAADTGPDRVDLVTHEQEPQPAADEAAPYPDETPAWRGGGEGWR